MFILEIVSMSKTTGKKKQRLMNLCSYILRSSLTQTTPSYIEHFLS